MGVSLQVPWFSMGGFGPLGLPLDPADYGQSQGSAPMNALLDPASSEASVVHAGAGGVPVSYGERLLAASVPPSDPTGGGSNGTRYELTFIGGNYQGTKLPLRTGETYIVGRGTRSDIALVDPLVSGRHATIVVTDTGLSIEDLGSANGTLVNGVKIKKKTDLKSGDRILIGRSRMVIAEKAASSEAPSPASAPTRNSNLSGELGGQISLMGLLQFFQMERVTGVCEINGERKARLHFRKGGVFHATIEGLPGLDPLKAFFRLVTWQTGAFALLPSDAGDVPESITLPPEGLLMESLRHLDELEHLRPQLPQPTAALSLAEPAPTGRVDLTPAEVEVLRLLPDQETLQALLDASPLSDLETCQALIALMKKGYIEQER